MTITVKVTRDETLRIKVAPDILRRLEQLALRFAAHVVGLRGGAQ